MRTYVIDITAYEHVATIKVEAESPEEAIRLACEKKNISVKIASSTDERCRCGQWPIGEYGPECPSCPPKVDADAVRDLARLNPPHAIRGWLAGYQANADTANVILCEAALALQEVWRTEGAAGKVEHRVSYFSEPDISRAVCSCGWHETSTDEDDLANLFDEHLGEVAAAAGALR